MLPPSTDARIQESHYSSPSPPKESQHPFFTSVAPGSDRVALLICSGDYISPVGAGDLNLERLLLIDTMHSLFWEGGRSPVLEKLTLQLSE
ncbi:hypothetical protein EJB05_28915, partial [Eragrostis curvula]